jgi:hypothetical protein
MGVNKIWKEKPEQYWPSATAFGSRTMSSSET